MEQPDVYDNITTINNRITDINKQISAYSKKIQGLTKHIDKGGVTKVSEVEFNFPDDMKITPSNFVKYFTEIAEQYPDESIIDIDRYGFTLRVEEHTSVEQLTCYVNEYKQKVDDLMVQLNQDVLLINTLLKS